MRKPIEKMRHAKEMLAAGYGWEECAGEFAARQCARRLGVARRRVHVVRGPARMSKRLREKVSRVGILTEG